VQQKKFEGSLGYDFWNMEKFLKKKSVQDAGLLSYN